MLKNYFWMAALPLFIVSVNVNAQEELLPTDVAIDSCYDLGTVASYDEAVSTTAESVCNSAADALDAEEELAPVDTTVACFGLGKSGLNGQCSCLDVANTPQCKAYCGLLERFGCRP